MAPKSENAKKETGRAKKAENEAKKKESAQAEKEKKEAAEWDDGAKVKKDDKEAKKKAEAARKAENTRLLAEEEAAISAKPKVAPKAAKKGEKPAPKPAGPGAIAAGGLASTEVSVDDEKPEPPGKPSTKKQKKAPVEIDKVVESFAATGLDDALDLLDVVTAKTDKSSLGAVAGKVEQHPERRFKAAYKEYEEAQLPILRQDRPGLRLQQYKDLIYKQFQKAPENPFNQTLVSYDATKEDKVEAVTKQRRQVEERLRE